MDERTTLMTLVCADGPSCILCGYAFTGIANRRAVRVRDPEHSECHVCERCVSELVDAFRVVRGEP